MANGRRGSRQRKEWNSLGSTAAPIALTGSSTAIVAGTLDFQAAVTVLRMLGEYTINPGAAAPVSGDSCRIGVGIGVISSDAATLGATAAPDPNAEAEYPWLYWAVHPMVFRSTSQDPSSAAASVRHRFDVRSMRKIKPRESLVMIVEYLNNNGDPEITFFGGTVRVLIGTG